MSLAIDLKNAVNKKADNFTCLLMQLMFKSDPTNFRKLADVYPIEANMVWLYKNDCNYIDKVRRSEVDFEELERRAKELHNHEEDKQEIENLLSPREETGYPFGV